MGFLDRLKRDSRARLQDGDGRVLLVPTPDTGQEPRGPRVLAETEEVSFIVVQDEDGRSVLPVFTSEEAFLRWKPEGSSYVGLPERVLVEILAGSDWHRMVVDGADEDALVITREAARELIGAAHYVVPGGSVLLIGQPAQAPPAGLIDAVRAACERRPAVAEGYLYQMAIVDRDEVPHLAIGLRLDSSLDDEAVRTLVDAVGSEVQPRLWGLDFIDFQVLDDDMLAEVQSSGPPVFRRP